LEISIFFSNSFKFKFYSAQTTMELTNEELRPVL
jgi:hypothetical protein